MGWIWNGFIALKTISISMSVGAGDSLGWELVTVPWGKRKAPLTVVPGFGNPDFRIQGDILKLKGYSS